MPKTIAQIIAEAALAATSGARKNQPKEPYEGQSRAGSSSGQMQRDKRWTQYIKQKAQKRPASKPLASYGPPAPKPEKQATPEVVLPDDKLDWGALTSYAERQQRESLKSSMRDLYSTRPGQTKPENFDDDPSLDPALRDMAGDKNLDYTVVNPGVIKNVSKRDSTTGMSLARKYIDDYDNSINDNLTRDDHDELFDLAYPDGVRVRDGKSITKDESWVVSSARGTNEQGMLANALPGLQLLGALGDIPHQITTELGYARQKQRVSLAADKVDPSGMNLDDAVKLDPETFDISKLPPYYRAQVDPASVPQFEYVKERFQSDPYRGVWGERLVQKPVELKPDGDAYRDSIYKTIVERYKQNDALLKHASEVYTPSMWINEVLAAPSAVSEGVFSSLEGRAFNEQYAHTNILPSSYENSTHTGDELVLRVKNLEQMLGQPLSPEMVRGLPRGWSKEEQDQFIEAARANGTNPGREYFADGLDWHAIQRSLDLLGVPGSKQEEIASKLGYEIGDRQIVEARIGDPTNTASRSYTSFTVKNPDQRVQYDALAGAGISFVDANGDVVESAAAPDIVFEFAMRGDLSRSRTNAFMDFVGDVMGDPTNYGPLAVVWKPLEYAFEAAGVLGKTLVVDALRLADKAISTPLKVANRIIGKEVVKAIPERAATSAVEGFFTETVNSSALKFSRRAFSSTASTLKPEDLYGDGAANFVDFKFPQIAEAAREGDLMALMARDGISPTSVKNVANTINDTEKFLRDLAVEGAKDGPEDQAKRAIINRAKGYIKGSGQKVDEARELVVQRISEAFDSGHYDDLVSAAKIIESELRDQANDQLSVGKVIEITAKLLNEGQMAYGSAKLGIKKVTETAGAAAVNKLTNAFWGGWTNLVLTLRPGWQVVNYIDNTFRMLINGDLLDLGGKRGGFLLSSSRAEDILSRQYGLTKADIASAIRRYYGDQADEFVGLISSVDGKIFDPVSTTVMNSLKKYAKTARDNPKQLLGELWKTLKSIQPRIEGGAAIKVFAREYINVFDDLFGKIAMNIPDGLLPSPEEIVTRFNDIKWLNADQKGYYAQRLLEERRTLDSWMRSVTKNMALNPQAYAGVKEAASAVVGSRSSALRWFVDNAMPAEMPRNDLSNAISDFMLAHLDGVDWTNDQSVAQLETLVRQFADTKTSAEKVVKTAQAVTENPPPMSEFAERELVNAPASSPEEIVQRAEMVSTMSRAAEPKIVDYEPYSEEALREAVTPRGSRAVRGMYLDTMNPDYNSALDTTFSSLNTKQLGYNPSRTGKMLEMLDRRLKAASPEDAPRIQKSIDEFRAWLDRTKNLKPRPTGINAWQEANLSLPYREYMRELESELARVGKPLADFNIPDAASAVAYVKRYQQKHPRTLSGGHLANDLEAVERYAKMRLELQRLVDSKTPVNVRRAGEGEFTKRPLTLADLTARGTEIEFQYRVTAGGKLIDFNPKVLLPTKTRKTPLSVLEYIENGYVESGRTISKITRGTWIPVIDVNSQTDELVRLVKNDVLAPSAKTPNLNKLGDEVEQAIDLANARASVVRDASPVLDELIDVSKRVADDPVDMSEYVDLIAAQGEEAIGGAPLPQVSIQGKLIQNNIQPAARLNAEMLREQLLGVIERNKLPITDEEADHLYNFMVATALANDVSSGWQLGETISRVSGVTPELWTGDAVFQVNGAFVATHNLHAGNLSKTINELSGKFPMPSLAITKKEYPLDQFGDITLVAKPTLVDPSSNPVFDVDAWTPTFPEVRRGMYGEQYDKIVKSLRPGINEDYIRGIDLNNVVKNYTSIPDEIIDDLYGGNLPAKRILQKSSPIVGTKSLDKLMASDKFISAVRSNDSTAALKIALDISDPEDLYQVLKTEFPDWLKTLAPTDDEYDILSNFGRMVIGSVRRRQENGPKFELYNSYNSLVGEFDSLDGALSEFNKIAANEIMRSPALAGLSLTGDMKILLEDSKIGYYFSSRLDFEDVLSEDGLLGEFNKRIDDITGGVKIANYIEPTGKDITPENVLEAMRLVAGGDLRNVHSSRGVAQLRASGSNRITSERELYQRSDQLVGAKKAREYAIKAEESLNDLRRTETGPYTEHILDDYLRRYGELSDYDGMMGIISEYLVGVDVQDDTVDRALRVVRDIMRIPTDYFEAKPDRLVDLSEFGAAIVPVDTGKSIIDALEATGVKVVKYKNESERKRAVRETAENFALLFNQTNDGFVKGFNQHVFSPESVQAARSLIGLLEGADADTVFEEWSHHLFKTQSGERKAVMYGWANAPKDATGDYLSHWDVSSEINRLVNSVGLTAEQSNRLKFLRSVESQARQADERLVLAFRKYVMTGIAPNRGLKQVFEQIKRVLIKSWQSVKAFARVKISPELRAAFDDMLGADPQFMAEQIEQLTKAGSYITGQLPVDLSDLRKIADDVSGYSQFDVSLLGASVAAPAKRVRANVSKTLRGDVETLINRLDKISELYAGGTGLMTGDYDEAIDRFAIAAAERSKQLRELLDYAEQNNISPAVAWRSGDFTQVSGKYARLTAQQRRLEELEKQLSAVSTMGEFGRKPVLDADFSVKLTANKSKKLMDMVKKGDIDGLVNAYNYNATLSSSASAEKLERIRVAIIAVYDRVLKGESNYYDALTGKAVEPDKLAVLQELAGKFTPDGETSYRDLSKLVDEAYVKAGAVRVPGGVDMSKFDIDKFAVDRPTTVADITRETEDEIDRIYQNIISTKIEGYEFLPVTEPNALIRSGEWEDFINELTSTRVGKVIESRLDTKMTVKQFNKLVFGEIKDTEKAKAFLAKVSFFLPRDRKAEIADVLDALKNRLGERPSLVKIVDAFNRDLRDLTKAGSPVHASFDDVSNMINSALKIPASDVPTGVLAQAAPGDALGKWFESLKSSARSGIKPDMSALALLDSRQQQQVMNWLSEIGMNVAKASRTAQERAGQRVNDVLMDYNTTLGVDAFLTRGPAIQSGKLEGLEPMRIFGGFVPFAKFPRMNMLYLFEQLKHRPQMVRWFNSYQQNINEQRESRGLPTQTIPAIPVELGDLSAEINPMSVLSGKAAINAVSGYIPDYFSPAERFLAQIKNFGFSLSPGVTSALMLFKVIRPESASYFSLIPTGQALGVIPGAAKTIGEWNPLVSSLLGVTSPGDTRGIIKQLGYNALADVENASEWNKQTVAQQYIAAMESRTGPKWDTAMSDYYDSQGGARAVGYLTGSYPRVKTDAEAQYQQYKADIETLRNTLDGMGALDDDSRARLDAMISDTPEQYAQKIINTATPRDKDGNLLLPTDEEVKREQDYAAEQNRFNQEKARIIADYFATHNVKVGLTQFDADWDAVQIRLNQLEQDYAERTKDRNYNPKTQQDVQAKLRANLLSMLSNSKPAYTGDYDKWKKDAEAWYANLPDIASKVWKSITPALKALGQPEEMPAYLRASATRDEMRKFEARFYTLDRAMGEVWSRNYYDGYWTAVKNKSGKERLLAEKEYLAAHQPPTDKELYKWLESDIFKGRFSMSDVAARIKELGGVASIKDKLLQGKDIKSVQGDDLSSLLSRIPPGRAFYKFKDSLSPEMQRYLDAYTVDNYKPLDSDEKWSDFYFTVKPLLESQFSDPDTGTLREWVNAEQLNKGLESERERRWPGIGEMIKAYGPMSSTERKAYRAEHPEVSAYYDWLYNKFAKENPLWAKYYSSAEASSSSGQAVARAQQSYSRGYSSGGGRRYYGGGGGSYTRGSGSQTPYNAEQRGQWMEFRQLLGDTLWGELNSYWNGAAGLSSRGSDLLKSLYNKYQFGAASYEDWLNNVLPSLASAMLPGHSLFHDPQFFNFQYQPTPYFSDNKYWFSNVNRKS